eukprot:89249-Chlamydomonas_euryale.AAC.5
MPGLLDRVQLLRVQCAAVWWQLRRLQLRRREALQRAALRKAGGNQPEAAPLQRSRGVWRQHHRHRGLGAGCHACHHRRVHVHEAERVRDEGRRLLMPHVRCQGALRAAGGAGLPAALRARVGDTPRTRIPTTPGAWVPTAVGARVPTAPRAQVPTASHAGVAARHARRRRGAGDKHRAFPRQRALDRTSAHQRQPRQHLASAVAWRHQPRRVEAHRQCGARAARERRRVPAARKQGRVRATSADTAAVARRMCARLRRGARRRRCCGARQRHRACQRQQLQRREQTVF